MWIAINIFTTLFPEKCILCRESGDSLCSSCARKLQRAVDAPYPWIYSYFSYRDPFVRKIIRRFKYFHMLSLGKACTEIMIEKSRDLTMLLNNTSSLLVPIPMPRLRKWTRGGNHAEYIATTISTKTHIPFHTHLLIRKKTTHQQARFRTRSEREKGITGAFGVDTKMLLESPIPKDTKIILVDDVTTTGATLLEAKKVLEKAGFTSISAITIAH